MANASLVVLAAGMGSRYGGLKQVEPVGPDGELLLEYSIYDALSAGFRRVLLVIQSDQEAAFRDLLPATLLEDAVEFVHQRPDDLPGGVIRPRSRRKPWGTGHAVYAARDAVCDPFAVVNADDFYGSSSYAQIYHLLTEATSTRDQYALVGFRLEQTLSPHGAVHRGLCEVDAAGCLRGIHERRGLRRGVDGRISSDEDGGTTLCHAPDALVSMNLWGFPAELPSKLETPFLQFLVDPATDKEHDEFYLPHAVDRVRRADRVCVRVLQSGEPWMGVTYREDLSAARQVIGWHISQGAYPRPLWRGSA